MRSDEGAAFGPALLAQVPATMSTVDRGLVTELFYGVLRHRAALDWRLAACSQRHLARLAPPTLTLLRLGAYQLLFLSRVPASAAVNGRSIISLRSILIRSGSCAAGSNDSAYNARSTSAARTTRFPR